MGYIKDFERRLGKMGSQALLDIKRYGPVLLAHADEPKAASKPARDLSAKEAFDIVMYLILHGEIKLTEEMRFDGRGNLTYPAAGQRITAVPLIAGVEFYRCSIHANEKNGSLKGAHKADYIQPDPAFAVVLFRLAKFLKEKWRTTRIVWGGIGTGSNKAALTCHETGTCFDFYGAYTGRGNFDVAFDWALKPVVRPNKADRSRWKPSEHQTFYRLQSATDDPAFSFFKDVYDFATTECTDGPASPTTIGAASAIIHPDHPDPRLRGSHQEHMHMQVGNAFL